MPSSALPYPTIYGRTLEERPHLCPRPPLLEDTGIRTRRRERTSAGMRTAAGSTKRKQMQTNVNDAKKIHSMQPPSHTRAREKTCPKARKYSRTKLICENTACNRNVKSCVSTFAGRLYVFVCEYLADAFRDATM